MFSDRICDIKQQESIYVIHNTFHNAFSIGCDIKDEIIARIINKKIHCYP